MPFFATRPLLSKALKSSFLLVLAIGVIFAVFVWVDQSELLRKRESTGEATRTPPPYLETRTPTLALPSGKQSYSVSVERGAKGPSPRQIIVDPLDPKIGDQQIISIKIEDSQPIQSVSVIVFTDNKQENVGFELVNGGNLEGIWQGSWIVDDSYKTIYSMTIFAEGESGRSQVEFPIR